jgi:hypothetical protein
MLYSDLLSILTDSHQPQHNKALHPTAYSLRYASFLGFASAFGGG